MQCISWSDVSGLLRYLGRQIRRDICLVRKVLTRAKTECSHLDFLATPFFGQCKKVFALLNPTVRGPGVRPIV
jgi:hypothetical protein